MKTQQKKLQVEQKITIAGLTILNERAFNCLVRFKVNNLTDRFSSTKTCCKENYQQHLNINRTFTERKSKLITTMISVSITFFAYSYS